MPILLGNPSAYDSRKMRTAVESLPIATQSEYETPALGLIVDGPSQHTECSAPTMPAPSSASAPTFGTGAGDAANKFSVISSGGPH